MKKKKNHKPNCYSKYTTALLKFKLIYTVKSFASITQISIQSELSVGEEDWRNHGPDEQGSSSPTRYDTNPNRRPTHIHQLSALSNGSRPTCEKHGRVHAS